MLSSVEQAFVGREEIRAPLKTPAWEAKTELDFTQYDYHHKERYLSTTVVLSYSHVIDVVVFPSSTQYVTIYPWFSGISYTHHSVLKGVLLRS